MGDGGPISESTKEARDESQQGSELEAHDKRPADGAIRVSVRIRATLPPRLQRRPQAFHYGGPRPVSYVISIGMLV